MGKEAKKLKIQSSKLKRSLKPQAPKALGALPSARAWVRQVALRERFRPQGQPLVLGNWSFS
jgi:hypothetical protein